MWDATSRSMHFRFEAIKEGAVASSSNLNNSSIIPEEPEL